MIHYDAIPVGTPLVCQNPRTGRVYEGTYFGREIRSCAYGRYPIIKIESPKYHTCVSENGECNGLWIEERWDVSVVQKPANISELF